MSASQAAVLLTSILNQVRAHDRFEAGRRVLSLVGLGALAFRVGAADEWLNVRNVAVHGRAETDQATALNRVAAKVEGALPELDGVFTRALVPDVLQAAGELPGLTALSAQTLEVAGLPAAEEFGAWFDEALDLVSVGRNMGEFTTPRSLAELMAALAAPETGQRVLDPSCGLGTILARAGARTPHLELHGRERSALAAAYARLRLFLLGQSLDIRVENALKVEAPPAEGTRFDRVVCNPPFGAAGADLEDQLLKQRFPGIPFRYEALFLHHCLSSLRADGRAVVAVPYPFLQRKGRDAEYRRHLVEAGLVEGVVALPSGVVTWTDVPIALLLLRKTPMTGGVVLIDAKFLKGAGRRAAERLDERQVGRLVDLYFGGSDPEHRIEVTRHALLAADGDLQPLRHLGSIQSDRVAPEELLASARLAEARAEEAKAAFDRALDKLLLE